MSGESVGVVFVHGFLSSAATWSRLIRLIRADQALADLTTHTFEYASPPVSLSPLRRIPNLNDLGDALRTYLANELPEDRPAVLVTHSQGGLVVQRFLARTLADGRGHELARIRRVVMFACPNSGSELALLLRRRVRFWRNPQERELRPLHEAVTDAHRIVVNQVIHATGVGPDRCRIPIVAYAGERDAVVTPTSAKSVFPEVGVLPGDHFSIIQPDSDQHRSYAALRGELRAAAVRATSEPETGRTAPVAAAVPKVPAVMDAPRSASAGPLAPARLGALVDRLLAVPGMAEPDFRQQVYDLLPHVVVHQLRRGASARLELVGLVHTFQRYPNHHPWEALVAALASLLPEQPAVRDLAATLVEIGLTAAPGAR